MAVSGCIFQSHQAITYLSTSFPIPWNAPNITALCVTSFKNDQKPVEASPSCDHAHRSNVSAPVNMKASVAIRPNVDLFATLSICTPFSAPLAIKTLPLAIPR